MRGPIAQCVHVTFDEYILNEGEKNQPYIQCRKIVGDFDAEIAMMIYEIFKDEIPKGIVNMSVSFASGYWLNLEREGISHPETK